MTGHRSFDDLRNRMTPSRRGRNDTTTKLLLQEMTPYEPQQAQDKTKQDAARDMTACKSQS